jgi:hypothetical protein
MNYGGSHGQIKDNHIIGNTLANPIILQAPDSFIEVSGNDMPGTSTYGDTCIETVDYNAVSLSTNANIQIHDNKLNNCGAWGVSVVGGHNITIANNDIIAASRGIYVASETSSNTAATDGVLVTGNNISGIVGDYDILFWGGHPGYPVTNSEAIGNKIYLNGAAGIGIQVGACDSCNSSTIEVQGITLSKNEITGDGTHGTVGIVNRGAADVTEEGNTISTMAQQGISNCCGNSGTLKVIGNHVSNLSLASSGGYEAIQLGNSGFTHVEAANNDYTAGANAVSHFLTCSGSYDTWASGNIGSANDISGCTVKTGLFSTLPSTQTSSYTFLLADKDNYTLMNCGSACSLTVPPNVFIVGQSLCFSQTGTGAVSIAAGSGVTITTYSTLNLQGQYASGCVKEVGTNSWIAVGNFQ